MTASGAQLPQRPIYDRLAQHYETVMRPLERWFLERLRAQLLSQLPQGGYILEVGVGSGLNFRFYPRGTRGAALEPSGEMLKLAKHKARPEGVSLVQSWAENLPFASASFDAAFATLVFCSVTSQREVFAELRRVVKEGGTIMLLEHVRPPAPLGLIFDVLSRITVALCDDHFNRRTADEARASGLQLLKVESYLMGIINLISCRV